MTLFARCADRDEIGVGAGFADRNGRGLFRRKRLHFVVGADVRLGRPVEICVALVREFLHQRAQMFGRKNFAGEKDDPESCKVPLFEFAAGLEQRQDHRNGIPDGDFLILDKGRKLERKHGKSLGHERDRGARCDRDENIEDREIEIEMARGLRAGRRAVIPNVATLQFTKVSALRCESMTPFGVPVEPEVKRI